MIFIPKQDKKEDLLIFDLKMRRIRYICPKITQNFHYQIKNLTHQELKEKFPPVKKWHQIYHRGVLQDQY